ncbi:hypothetical protein C4J87_1111 [Pseudomonas sp. R1-43-08]|nr:hypothetical protein C4J88_1123 [Pseudomonas sp. R4-39-08]AZF41286.1 hypothetical protein C4J87_1111 [Pseudomonas sp. R1-43-08]AZF51613.1 hypothetical protein C4J85_1112 [Pseudomonas sp. R4-34-07]
MGHVCPLTYLRKTKPANERVFFRLGKTGKPFAHGLLMHERMNQAKINAFVH